MGGVARLARGWVGYDDGSGWFWYLEMPDHSEPSAETGEKVPDRPFIVEEGSGKRSVTLRPRVC